MNRTDSHFYSFRVDLGHHHVAVILAIVFCVWTSLWLVVRLWLTHRNDPFLKRLIWSLVLCLPFFGWVAYGAFYVPLPSNTIRAGGRRYGG